MASAKAEAQRVADTVQEQGEHYLSESQQWLEQADDMVRQAMREHPAACLFGALALGYSIGRLIARR